MRTVAEKRLWLLFSALFAPFTLAAANGLSFEPNLGQTGSDIRYVARASSGVIFITERGIILRGTDQSVPAFELSGADSNASWHPEAAASETISYFVGRDPSKWLENIPRYQRLVRRNVYPGIDLILYGSNGQLEYDFQIAPHADPSRIRLKLTDARHISIAGDGSLVVDTSAGELRHRAPILTEILSDGSRRNIAGSFRIAGPNEIGFSVENHDPDVPLSIDPVLESSTYFGGHGDDQVIATDGGGTLVGNTTSIDVPNATFARRAGTSVFIQVQSQTSVFGCSGNVTATAAVLTTYFEPVSAVVGYADCSDLPTTGVNRSGYQLSLQPNYSGGATDGFLLLFYPSVQAPLAISNISLSYIGGPGDDRVNAVSINNIVAIAGSTTAGGLPAPGFSTPNAGAFAGGMDAFVVLLYPDSEFAPQVAATSYLGGSGDDTALGIYVSNLIYVTGETKSSNFPLTKPLYSKRQGDSDAFVASFYQDGTFAASTLFGGSGSDSGAAIVVLPSGNVAVAGVSSSTDLPLKNPTQKAYGGGSSDAFLAQFTPNLDTLVSSTFIGGSEADAATSLAVTSPNTIFVGGWTASQNFPVVNALQPKYGGGPDDGFLVHFQDDGSIYESTFFGGSGGDQVLGLATAYYSSAPNVWLVGTTSSPNLALKNPTQSTLLGNSDGFVAEIAADLLTATPVIGGKDLRTYTGFGFGNPQLGATTTFKITSSDSAKVQVAAGDSTPGAASVELQPTNSNSGAFYVDCLTDSGGANLTISAPVYGSKTVPVTCYPESIQVSWSTPLQNSQTPPNQVQTNIGSGFTMYFELVPATPAQVVVYSSSSSRPGVPPVIVDVSSSNPSIGTLSPTSIALEGNNNLETTFSALAIGKTELTFDAGGIQFFPASTLDVIVNGSFFPVAPFAIPTGYEGAIFLPAASNMPPPVVTVTSKNPARIALSLDPTKKGTASVTLGGSTRQLWGQALGSSGSTELVFSVPGQPDITAAVSITTPTLYLSFSQNTGQPIQLALGGSASMSAYIRGADPNTIVPVQPNPGTSPITFTANSSHSGVVAFTPTTSQLLPGNGAGADFSFTATGAGSTVVTVTNSANIPISRSFHSATVNVGSAAPGISFPDVEIGKNLIAPMRLTLPTAAKSDVVVTASVNDPTLALFSLDAVSPGIQQITTIIPGGQSFTVFYIHALTDSGTAKVTVNLTGYSPVTASVNLDRSGFFWSQDTFTTSVGPASGSVPQILVGPLDAVSGIPVGTQSLDLSVGGALAITSSNSRIVTVTPAQYVVNGSASPQIVAESAGTATLSLSSLSGFTTPSVRQKLTVDVSATPPPYLTAAALGKYLQTTLSFGGYSGNPKLTVTSSDPSKVLLTTDVTKRGSGKITAQGQQIYAQALASSGKVTITITAAGYPKVAAVFTLIPVGFGIVIDQGNQSGATFQNGIYTTTTQSIALNVEVGLFLSANLSTPPILVPGVAPLKVSIASSNTGVAVITGSPITIPVSPQSYQLGTATLLQVSPGETTISISQPPGFTAVGNDHLTVQVEAPSLTTYNTTVAKDTLTSAAVQLGQGLKPVSVDLPITLTSSDPKRILLSPDATTPPTASLMVTMPAGSGSASVFVHALSDNGTVPIQVTAAGFMTNPWTIQLCPLAFALTDFASQNGQPVNAVIQQGPQTATVAVGPLTIAGFNPNGGPFTLRPGVAPIKVAITSSNAGTVSVTPSITFSGTFNNTPVTFTPLKAGAATLSLKVPPGYAVVPTEGQLSIQAVQAAITFSGGAYQGPAYQVGKDLQEQLNVSVPLAPPNASMTITSSDPSRLLLATDNMTPGQASITLPVTATAYVQALAGSGSAKLTATTHGYAPATLQVNFTPAGVVFGPIAFEQNVFTNAGVLQQAISLVALDPVTLRPGPPQLPRPGTNLSAVVTSSDPKVIAVTTPSVPISIPQQFNQLNLTIGVQPVSQGTAIVTIALAGNPAPEYGNQMVFNVTEPGLAIPAIVVGQDLQAPVQISLGSAIATPAADLKITVNGGGTTALSNDSAAVGQSQIQVTIPAGKRISNPFYVQGMYPGTSTLNFSLATTQQYYSTPITVTQTAFVIQEAANGPLNLSAGTTSNLTVIPTLSPQPSSAPSVPWTIRPGAQPIAISITSANTVVATTSPAQITFNPGDQKQVFAVQAVAAGTTTVQLLGSVYDFSQPQASIAVTVK